MEDKPKPDHSGRWPPRPRGSPPLPLDYRPPHATDQSQSDPFFGVLHGLLTVAIIFLVLGMGGALLLIVMSLAMRH